MKVYIVHEAFYPEHYTLGVYSTREKALARVEEAAEYGDLTYNEEADHWEGDEGDVVVMIEEAEVDV